MIFYNIKMEGEKIQQYVWFSVLNKFHLTPLILWCHKN